MNSRLRDDTRDAQDEGDFPHDHGMIAGILADGPGLLTVTALGLIAAGVFAWFLAVSDQLLPHDLAWLTVSEGDLRAVADGRLVHFMAHDRAAFGGTLISIGVLYLWLIRFPLRNGLAWAWWLLAIGGSLGFLTFLTYLGTGYLDTWHGLATLALLPPFALGLVRTRGQLAEPLGPAALLQPSVRPPIGSSEWFGRAALLLTAFGMFVAGTTIVTIGTFVVFVPQDLAYLGLDRPALDSIDPRLVPLIAHDRSGFGGGLAITAITVFGCVFAGRPTRSLWEALLIAGIAGFGAAIGVHGLIAYLDLTHVGPAIAGAMTFALGMGLSAPAMRRAGSSKAARSPSHDR